MRPMVIFACAVLILAGVTTLIYVSEKKPAAQTTGQPVAPVGRIESPNKTVSKEMVGKTPERQPHTVAMATAEHETPAASQTEMVRMKTSAQTAPVATPAPVSTQPALSAAVGATPTNAAVMGEVPLVLQLPPRKFNSTPPNIKLTGIEVITQQAPLLVPPDVKLISRGKAVRASDMEPIIGNLTMVTDGDKEAYDGSFVELAPTMQWVQIDLDAPSEVFAIALWHFHAQARVYHDVIVRCADDKDFTSGARTLFNNDADNSAGLGIGQDKEYLETNLGKLIDVRLVNGGLPVKTRYLRFYSNGNTANELNHYVEIEVYGRPTK